MTLRLKTLILIVITIIGSIFAVYVVAQDMLLSRFVELETELAQDNIERAVNALDGKINAFAQLNEDWAHWDDTYQFIDDGNPEYIDANLNNTSLGAVDVDVVAYIDDDGNIIWGRRIFEDGMGNLPTGLSLYLTAEGPLRNIPEPRATNSGLVQIDDTLMVVASSNILPSNRFGTSNGVLVWGRYLDDTELVALEQETRLSLDIYEHNDAPEDVDSIYTTLIREPSVVSPMGDDVIAAYAGIPDIYAGVPVFVLRMDMPRDITTQGERAIQTFMIVIAVGGVLGGIGILGAMEWLVLSRLSRLNRGVQEIGQSGDPQARVQVEGSDELTGLQTEINRMLQALQVSQQASYEQEKRLRLIVDGAPIAIFALDRAGKFTLLEGRKLASMGLSLEGIESIYDKRIKASLPQFIEYYEHALSGETLRTEIALSSAIFDVWYAPIFAESGEISGVMAVATDITDLKAIEKALVKAKDDAEEASRAKSSFLANMSHELRTPLNAVIGYSELVMEEMQDSGDDEFIPDLDKIKKSGAHLLALINDILDLSKIEAGKMELNIETFSVSSLVDGIISTIYPLAEKNGNTLKMTCPDDIGMMTADLTRVRQILINLMNNANKFTENGMVEITVTREHFKDQDWINYSIKDTGIGMSDEQTRRLFQDFQQGDSSTTRKYGGTGLGLSISRRFAHMMGGEVLVQSQPGQGSTFTVMLPAEVEYTPPEIVTEDTVTADSH